MSSFAALFLSLSRQSAELRATLPEPRQYLDPGIKCAAASRVPSARLPSSTSKSSAGDLQTGSSWAACQRENSLVQIVTAEYGGEPIDLGENATSSARRAAWAVGTYGQLQ